jgi:hypothetical protein
LTYKFELTTTLRTMNIDTNIRKIQKDVRIMQRTLINITKEVEKVTTILARSNNGVCSKCSNFDTTTDHSSGSSNDDSGDSDSDGDEDKPSGQSKQSKPERTKSSTSITSPNCGGRTRQTARGTAASSEKSNRERNAKIIAMLSTEERKNFYEQLSKWVKKEFGRSHCITTLHLSLNAEEFEYLQLHQNWWIRLNLSGPIQRLAQVQDEERAEERRSKKRKRSQEQKKK